MSGHSARGDRSSDVICDAYRSVLVSVLFFFNDTATTEIYTLSLHDALPISIPIASAPPLPPSPVTTAMTGVRRRSEEHTSELQSQSNLVCRLLLEKKKSTHRNIVALARAHPMHIEKISGYLQSLLHHNTSDD